MMSLSSIQALADEQAAKAAKRNRKPYVPYNTDDVRRFERFPFPNIGNYCPAGWKYFNQCQANKDGTGDSISFGIAGVKDWCVEQMSNHLVVGFAIIEEGEFQLVIGAFYKAH